MQQEAKSEGKIYAYEIEKENNEIVNTRYEEAYTHTI